MKHVIVVMQYSNETSLMGYSNQTSCLPAIAIGFFLLQLLGRNVYPVSMLSYIPESPLPHPRVRAIKKVPEDVLESSESQEESDPGPNHRKPKVIKLIATFLLLTTVFFR